MRKQSEVINDWAADLATRLTRPADRIRGQGLSAADFPADSRVRIHFGEGSFAEFRHAFACIRRDVAWVAVFTEHCGYMEFPIAPDMEVIEIRETSYYRHE